MLDTLTYKKRKFEYKIVFFVMFISIVVFFSDKELLYPYYLNFPQVTLIVVLIATTIGYLILNRTGSLDAISFILFTRLIIYILPLMYISTTEGYWGNYLCVIASFIAYQIGSHTFKVTKYKQSNESRVNFLVMVFLTLLSFQVIHMFFFLGKEYGTLNINLFKYYLAIPVGSSNYVSGLILPLLIFVIFAKINKISKISVITLSLIALVIIQSKNAIFTLCLFLLFIIMKKYFSFLKNNTNNQKVVISFSVFLILCTSFLGIKFFDFILEKWNMGLNYSGTTFYGIINALSSNRLSVYSQEIARWGEHILLGNGLGYDLGYIRSHNWIIDLLVQSGLLGFTVYILALVIWYLNIRSYRKDSKLINAVFYFVVIVLLQGLGEVTLFTITIDILFWFMIGLSISEKNVIKNNHQVYGNH